jgi:carboxymethylenebutenolidase
MDKTFKAADGHSFSAFVAQPQGAPKGLVVIAPEIFGVNSHIQAVAKGYAQAGYLAIAPALFDRVQRGYDTGYSPDEINAGVAIMKQLSMDQALLDVQAVLDARPAGLKAAVVGYCFGGTVAWLAASRLNGLAASVCYYGGAIPNYIDEKPKCPAILHFGETDASIPLDKAREVAARHPEAPAYFYAAGHGFNCDHRGSYDAASAALALERTLKFLQEKLS